LERSDRYVTGFHLWNRETRKAVSFTVYESREGLEAAGRALAQSGEDERAARDPEPDEVDYYTEVSEF
jgi:hypothetical protein